MSDAVLVLNAGSSSIKFGLFDISGPEPCLLCEGLLDEHEAKPGFTVTDAAGPGARQLRGAALSIAMAASPRGEGRLAGVCPPDSPRG